METKRTWTNEPVSGVALQVHFSFNVCAPKRARASSFLLPPFLIDLMNGKIASLSSSAADNKWSHVFCKWRSKGRGNRANCAASHGLENAINAGGATRPKKCLNVDKLKTSPSRLASDFRKDRLPVFFKFLQHFFHLSAQPSDLLC